MYETLLTEDIDGVALITLNCPDQMNVLTVRMSRELRHAILAFDARDDVRAIVVRGTGRAFCAGAGISADGLASDAAVDMGPDVPTTVPYWELNTPIIAAMNGSAAGAGMTIPLQWDLRVMATDAKYAFGFTRRGLLAELGSTWLLPRLIGVAKASDLLLTGRVFNGAAALELGLASAAHPADEVVDRSLVIARDIADNTAPLSVALTKRLLSRFLTEFDRDAVAALEEKILTWLVTQPDAVEGMHAFLEKRPANWTLRKNTDFPTELYSEPPQILTTQ